MIAKYVNGKQIMEMHNERNPQNKIGYQTALKIKKLCRELYEKEHGIVYLYDENVIPLSWYEAYFGEQAYAP